MAILSSDPAQPDLEGTAVDDRDGEDLPEYDWDEIRRHDKAGDFWVAFCGGCTTSANGCTATPVAPRS